MKITVDKAKRIFRREFLGTDEPRYRDWSKPSIRVEAAAARKEPDGVYKKNGEYYIVEVKTKMDDNYPHSRKLYTGLGQLILYRTLLSIEREIPLSSIHMILVSPEIDPFLYLLMAHEDIQFVKIGQTGEGHDFVLKKFEESQLGKELTAETHILERYQQLGKRLVDECYETCR